MKFSLSSHSLYFFVLVLKENGSEELRLNKHPKRYEKKKTFFQHQIPIRCHDVNLISKYLLVNFNNHSCLNYRKLFEIFFLSLCHFLCFTAKKLKVFGKNIKNLFIFSVMDFEVGWVMFDGNWIWVLRYLDHFITIQ